MGWTDVLKRKASELGLASAVSKLKPDPRLRWFGKLPTYADYYRSKGREAWAAEFNDWILQGYEVYHRHLQGPASGEPSKGGLRGKRMGLSGCVIRLPKSGMTVLASIQNYGGDMLGRDFPVCFYVGVPSLRWPGPTSDRVSGAARVIRDLTGLRHDVIRFCNSPGTFNATFGGRKLDLAGVDSESQNPSCVEAAMAVPLAEWFARARQDLKVKSPDSWFRLAREWGRCIAENNSRTFEPTLRFPLPSGLPLDARIAAWIRWLEVRMDLGDRLLSLIVTGVTGSENGHLTVIAREVVPDDFLLLTPLSGVLPYVDDLSQLETDEKQENEGAAETGPARGEPGVAGRWADFVEMST